MNGTPVKLTVHKCTIVSVDEDSFTARRREITCAGAVETPAAGFFLEDVAERYRPLVVDGGTFYCVRGLFDSPAGNRSRITRLVFGKVDKLEDCVRMANIIARQIQQLRQFAACTLPPGAYPFEEDCSEFQQLLSNAFGKVLLDMASSAE